LSFFTRGHDFSSFLFRLIPWPTEVSSPQLADPYSDPHRPPPFFQLGIGPICLPRCVAPLARPAAQFPSFPGLSTHVLFPLMLGEPSAPRFSSCAPFFSTVEKLGIVPSLLRALSTCNCFQFFFHSHCGVDVSRAASPPPPPRLKIFVSGPLPFLTKRKTFPRLN